MCMSVELCFFYAIKVTQHYSRKCHTHLFLLLWAQTKKAKVVVALALLNRWPNLKTASNLGKFERKSEKNGEI